MPSLHVSTTHAAVSAAVHTKYGPPNYEFILCEALQLLFALYGEKYSDLYVPSAVEFLNFADSVGAEIRAGLPADKKRRTFFDSPPHSPTRGATVAATKSVERELDFYTAILSRGGAAAAEPTWKTLTDKACNLISITLHALIIHQFVNDFMPDACTEKVVDDMYGFMFKFVEFQKSHNSLQKIYLPFAWFMKKLVPAKYNVPGAHFAFFRKALTHPTLMFAKHALQYECIPVHVFIHGLRKSTQHFLITPSFQHSLSSILAPFCGGDGGCCSSSDP